MLYCCAFNLSFSGDLRHRWELIVLSFVGVVELGWIQRIRSGKRIVNLGLFFFPRELNLSFFVGIDQTNFGVIEHVLEDYVISLGRVWEQARLLVSSCTLHFHLESFSLSGSLLGPTSIRLLGVGGIKLGVRVDQLVHLSFLFVFSLSFDHVFL